MSEPLVKEKELVVPGEILVKSMEFLPGRNCFREEDSIIAKRTGLVNIDHRVISIIPINSPYFPREGDMVIGEVLSIQNNGWVVLIDAPHDAFLPLSGVREYIDTRKTRLSRFYDVGDVIYAKISALQGNSIYLSMQDIKAKKFRGGRLVKINPAKVPRLIGRQGSMIKMIKDSTECRINAGQNGRVWIDGEVMETCVSAINIIEAESANEGLTDKIASFLGVAKPQRIEEPAKEPKEKPVSAQSEPAEFAPEEPAPAKEKPAESPEKTVSTEPAKKEEA